MNIRYTEAPGIEGKVIRIDGWEEDGHRMTGNGHWMIFDPSTGEELAVGLIGYLLQLKPKRYPGRKRQKSLQPNGKAGSRT